MLPRPLVPPCQSPKQMPARPHRECRTLSVQTVCRSCHSQTQVQLRSRHRSHLHHSQSSILGSRLMPQTLRCSFLRRQASCAGGRSAQLTTWMLLLYQLPQRRQQISLKMTDQRAQLSKAQQSAQRSRRMFPHQNHGGQQAPKQKTLCAAPAALAAAAPLQSSGR